MGEEVCREVRPEAELRRWNENPQGRRRQSQEPPDPKVGTSATCRMMGQRN